jgi:hypothetical protein
MFLQEREPISPIIIPFIGLRGQQGATAIDKTAVPLDAASTGYTAPATSSRRSCRAGMRQNS